MTTEEAEQILAGEGFCLIHKKMKTKRNFLPYCDSCAAQEEIEKMVKISEAKKVLGWVK